MLNEEEKEMSTKNKINYLINDIQNKLNKRVSNNNTYKNIYNQGYQAIPSNGYINNTPILNNNYITSANTNFPYHQVPFNDYDLRKIIKDEFSSLILPYQKDSNIYKNNIDKKLNDFEIKFEYIINAQNMGNTNDNAKIISNYLSSNISNENTKKNFEKLKNEYDSKFEELENKFNSVLEQIKIINEEKNKNEEKFNKLFIIFYIINLVNKFPNNLGFSCE